MKTFIPLLVIVVAGCAKDEPQRMTAEEADAAIKTWAARADQNAVKAKGAEDTIVGTGIMMMHLEIGDFDAALAANRRIGQPHHLAHAVSSLTSQGKEDDALRILAQIKDPAVKFTAQIRRARALANQHEFDKSLEVLGELEDSPAKKGSFVYILEVMAKAGHYDIAEAWAEHFSPSDDEQREAKQELLAHIEKCRLAGRRDLPPHSSQTLAQQARMGSVLFGTISDDTDIESLEKAADTHDAIERRSLLWSDIAWRYHKKANAPKARAAIDKSLEYARQVDNPLVKSFRILFVADFLVEIADNDTARALVAEALATGFLESRLDTPETKELAESFGQGIGDIFAAPLVVSVLVRTNHLDEAFEYANSTGEFSSAWMMLGAFCAAEGHLDRAEEQFELLSTKEAKSRFAQGVVTGLCQLRKQRTGK